MEGPSTKEALSIPSQFKFGNFWGSCCVSHCPTHLAGPQVPVPFVLEGVSTSWPLAWGFQHPDLNLQDTHQDTCTERIPQQTGQKRFIILMGFFCCCWLVGSFFVGGLLLLYLLT